MNGSDVCGHIPYIWQFLGMDAKEDSDSPFSLADLGGSILQSSHKVWIKCQLLIICSMEGKNWKQTTKLFVVHIIWLCSPLTLGKKEEQKEEEGGGRGRRRKGATDI